MNKSKKQILGILGLALVAGMTIFAIFLPSPEVAAANTYQHSNS